jgi:uncharacterized membrane protein YdjX (TVP38/TMEM64 family)
LIGVILIIISGYFIKDSGYITLENIIAFLKRNPLMAPFAFVAILVILTLLLMPTLPLNLGAGLIWGTYWGGLYTLIGSSIAAVIAFKIARYSTSDYIVKYSKHNAWLWLLRNIQNNGWKVVAFTRINPIFPTALLNYFYGLTPIRFRIYAIVTVIFIAPMTFLFAFIGDKIRGIFLNSEANQFLQNIFSISIALTIIIFIRIIYKKYSDCK